MIGALVSRYRTLAQPTTSALASLVLHVLAKLLLLATSILLARWLGPVQFGIYASALAILLILKVPAQLGLPTLLVRLLPTYLAREKPALLNGALRMSFMATLTMSLAVSLVAALVVSTFASHLSAQHAATLLWALAVLPLATALSLTSGILRGFHRIVSGQLAEIVIVPAALLVLLVLWKFLRPAGWSQVFESDTAMIIRLAATAIALILAASMVFPTVRRAIIRSAPEYDYATWLRSVGPLLVLGGFTIINTQTDVLMLVAITGPESAGIYQAAARGAELVAFSLLVINGVVQPAISRLYALGERDELQRLITRSTRIAIALALPVAIVVGVFSGPILRVVYGSEYIAGAFALSLLCVAQLINVSAGLVGQILVMTGHEWDAALGVGLGALVNIVLNFILIPPWGLAGAAAATGISIITWNAFLVTRVRIRTRLRSGLLQLTG